MSLVPGFRFHPTDEELLRYYLRRKICGKPLRFDGIAEIDIYKAEPWDLPGKSKLNTRDLEWYFFSVLYKKCGKGCRTNRATDRGYWKTTGNDRTVKSKGVAIGMKKTLVYHFGRAPHGKRTDWVMHEYRLIDEELAKAGFVQDSYVLCRIFQKSGTGPKNGEKYGAPLVEEEWEDEELEFVPKEEDSKGVNVRNDDCFNGNFLEQIHVADFSQDNHPHPLRSWSCQTNDFPLGNMDNIDDSKKVLFNNKAGFRENHQSNNQFQPFLTGSEAFSYVNDQQEDKKHFGLPVDAYDLARHQYVHEPSFTDNNPNSTVCMPGEQYLDAACNLLFDEEAFLETKDPSNPINALTSSSEDDCLTFFDSNGDISEYIAFDPPMMKEIQDLFSGDTSFPLDGEKEIQPVMSGEQIVGHNNDASKQTITKPATGIQYSYINKTSRMLGNIPAPPALALDIPMKQAARRLSSVPNDVTDLRNPSVVGRGTSWLTGKHGLYNVTVAFGLSRGEDNSTALESVVRIVPRKTTSGAFNGWFWFFLFWVVIILSICFKVRTLIYAP